MSRALKGRKPSLATALRSWSNEIIMEIQGTADQGLTMPCKMIGLIGPEICLWLCPMHEASEKGKSSTQCFSRQAEARQMRKIPSWQLLQIGPSLKFCAVWPHLPTPCSSGFSVYLTSYLWEPGWGGSRCQLLGHCPQGAFLGERSCSTLCNLLR